MSDCTAGPIPFGPDEPFTRRQAREAGISDKQLHLYVKARRLRRPIEGVYVAGSAPDSIPLRCRMLALVVPADAFVCDRTAAWLHLGDAALAPNEHLAVPPVSCFRPSDAGRLRNALTHSGERAVVARDLTQLHGIVVTTPLRTALDLGRLQRSRDMKLWGLDSMLGLGAFTHEQLLHEIPRFKGQRGVIMLRALAPLADGGAQSFGESSLRLRWYDGGLPAPRTQIAVDHDGGTYWLDMGLEDLLLAAEYDGEEWHSTDEQTAHDERRRHWMRAHRSWQIQVFRQAQVYGPRQDADLVLARAYAEARAPLDRRTHLV